MTPRPRRKYRLGRRVLNRVLHSYFRLRRGLTVGVRAVVRSQDGRFLLVRHTYQPGWHFPGGGLEPGRTAVEALGEELRQETGLELVNTPKIHGVFFNRRVSKRDHVIVYHCDVRGAFASGRANWEVAEKGFFATWHLSERHVIIHANKSAPNRAAHQFC